VILGCESCHCVQNVKRDNRFVLLLRDLKGGVRYEHGDTAEGAEAV
jgi:hypothetical protein